jgi:hypothetical protein
MQAEVEHQKDNLISLFLTLSIEHVAAEMICMTLAWCGWLSRDLKAAGLVTAVLPGANSSGSRDSTCKGTYRIRRLLGFRGIPELLSRPPP